MKSLMYACSKILVCGRYLCFKVFFALASPSIFFLSLKVALQVGGGAIFLIYVIFLKSVFQSCVYQLATMLEICVTGF